jgi:hypothetical protein
MSFEWKGATMAASSNSASSHYVVEIPVDAQEDTALLESESQDEVLPYQLEARESHYDAPSKRDGFKLPKIAWFWRLLPMLTFGTFLATCPLPRKYIPHALRYILMTFTASLVTFPASCQRKNIVVMQRILVAYLGFYLSVYAFFGCTDEVHFESRWQSLLWSQEHWGYGLRLGYLSRLALVLVAWFIMKRSRLYPARRILKTWLLCFVWIYADLPLTLVDLARQREHW